MPIAITPDGGKLVIRATEDVVRFNSLPFRSDFDTGARELAIARLIERTPELPLTCGSLQEFCESIARELAVRIEARLDGALNTAPAQPRSQMQLTVVDNAACFIAPKTSYFLVSDLEAVAHAGSSAVASTALGWIVGKRPSEPTSDRAPDVVVGSNGTISPIHSYSWVTGLELAPNPATGLYFYYSGLYAQKNATLNSDGTCCVGFGYPGASNAAGRVIQEATGGYSRVLWKYENIDRCNGVCNTGTYGPTHG
jgi:hypothetical protein